MSGSRARRLAARRAERGRVVRRAAMAAAVSVVTLVGTVTGTVAALDDDRARPAVAGAPILPPLPAVPSPSPSATTRTPTATPRTRQPAGAPARTERRRTPTVPTGRYHHPGSQVLDRVRAHPGDPRTAVIRSRI
ncbi:endoglucanase, partial [Streptomyces sp. SAS_269]